jgi:hypothetical protein
VWLFFRANDCRELFSAARASRKVKLASRRFIRAERAFVIRSQNLRGGAIGGLWRLMREGSPDHAIHALAIIPRCHTLILPS